jgi:hypothetical protein
VKSEYSRLVEFWNLSIAMGRSAAMMVDHEKIAADLGRAWSGMTDEQRMCEPMVMDEHFRDLVERGVLKMPSPAPWPTRDAAAAEEDG